MLNEAEIAMVGREVKTRTGAVITREMAGAVEIKLTPLSRREGFGTVHELISAARIRPDGALWNAVADHLAQSDTRFFRDRAIFENLRNDILPTALLRRGHERVRIWSAGCSTGQEPYSIAMIVEDMRAEGKNPAIELVATDASERLLDKARSGLYTQFEVQRGLPIRKLIAHFEKAGDLWRISDRLRASVRFEAINLMKHPGALGQFDIIMLAHVLPSFDLAMRAEVATRVIDALAPGGALILGAGETLPEGCVDVTITNGIVTREKNARAAA
ncbi:CheR family methyltransferase [Terricaulis silvestris]|uniref:Chemotaxis protein methyltransferase n=1 Tax=Terricaulis silvestris TaxID=2686094 RepID=A0A6I6ML69_9CAUL|nr:protein-glutamate O-methyltransferase CheR [Terricaulis silvestris]QGZ93988.1 Chemotaxis protein methyltransferase [Terricaulis silvestris]